MTHCARPPRAARVLTPAPAARLSQRTGTAPHCAPDGGPIRGEGRRARTVPARADESARRPGRDRADGRPRTSYLVSHA